MSRFTSTDLGKSAIKGTEMTVQNEGIITGISEDGWVRITTPLSLRRSKSEWVHEKEVILFTQQIKPNISEDIRRDVSFTMISCWIFWFCLVVGISINFAILATMSNAIDKIIKEQQCSSVNVVAPNESYVPTAMDEIAKQ